MSNKVMAYTRTILINGKELSEDRFKMVQDINITNNTSGSDLLTLRVLDPTLTFLNDDVFVKDAKIHFKTTLNNNKSLVFNGYISALDICFGEEGIAEINVHCMDNSYVLNKTKKSRTWKNTKTSDIVKSILSGYPSFKLFIEDTGEITKKQLESDPSNPNPLVEESTTQSNQTDMEFLMDLANKQVIDFICYVRGNEFHFEKRKILQKPQKTIWYKQETKDILTFDCQIDKANKKQEVTKKQISLVSKKLSSYVATDSSVDRELQGKPL